MNGILLYPAGNGPALRYACGYLAAHGFSVTPSPAPDVTHLLLPVPSFEADGRIRGGGILEHVLADLPAGITVVGGNLNHPALEGYIKMDLMQEPDYVCRNAAITAYCAVALAAAKLPVILKDCRVLILGWGRIGKALAQLLKAMGAKVTVAARKAADRGMLTALGYDALDFGALEQVLGHYRVVFNTAPEPIVDGHLAENFAPDCLKIDLASRKGSSGEDVIWARGLPGKDAPGSAGALIGQTLLRLLKKEGQR